MGAGVGVGGRTVGVAAVAAGGASVAQEAGSDEYGPPPQGG